MAKKLAAKTAPAIDPFDPFAAAPVVISAGSAKVNVILADAVVDPSGNVIYSKEEVVVAINDFIEGNAREKQGKTMKDSSRPVVEEFGLRTLAAQWLKNDKRPDNPKIIAPSYTRDDTGAVKLSSLPDRNMTFILQDSVTKLTPERYEVLCSCIGSNAASENTTKDSEFVFDSNVLKESITVKGRETTVMDVVRQALGIAFADHPEVYQRLITKNLTSTGIRRFGSGHGHGHHEPHVPEFYDKLGKFFSS